MPQDDNRRTERKDGPGPLIIDSTAGDIVEVEKETARAMVRDELAAYVDPPSNSLQDQLQAQREAAAAQPEPLLGFSLKAVRGPSFAFEVNFLEGHKIMQAHLVGLLWETCSWNCECQLNLAPLFQRMLAPGVSV